MSAHGRVDHDLAEISALLEQITSGLTEARHRIEQIRALRGRDDDASKPEPRSLVAFVHIPKTAGGTVKGMLKGGDSGPQVMDCGNFFRASEVTTRKLREKLASGRWAADGVAIGHVPYGVYRPLAPPGTRYVTFVREPVDRVVSHFYRHFTDRKQRVKLVGVDSLKEALLDSQSYALNNMQTRFLCSDPAPLGSLAESALDEAKANLSGFAFVGIQERFTESLVLFQRSLGLQLTPARDKHRNSNRPRVDEIDDEERELIEDHNRLDAELYRFALTLFEQRVAEADASFAAEVEALHAASKAVNERDNAEVEAAADWIAQALPPGTTKLDDTLREAAVQSGISHRLLRRAKRSLRRDGRLPELTEK